MTSSPHAYDLNFPEFLRADFGDCLDLCLGVTDEVLEVMRRNPDRRQLARHSPEIAVFDWETYIRLSVIRLVHVARQLKLHHRPGARVLDFGSYFGNFSLMARRMGFQVDALDAYTTYQPALAAERRLLEANGITIVDTGAEPDALAKRKGHYDVILMLGVIEHIPHTPKGLLVALCDALTDGGRLLVDTPNLAYEYNRRRFADGESTHPGIHYQFDTDSTFEGHHREFTLAELTWMLNRVGLDVDHRETYNYSLYGLSQLVGKDREIFRLMQADPTRREYLFASGAKLSADARSCTAPVADGAAGPACVSPPRDLIAATGCHLAADQGGEPASIELGRLDLEPGRYCLEAKATVATGDARIEVSAVDSSQILVSLRLPTGRQTQARTVWIDRAGSYAVRAVAVSGRLKLNSCRMAALEIAPRPPEFVDIPARRETLFDEASNLVPIEGFLLREYARVIGARGLTDSVLSGLSQSSVAPLQFERMAMLGRGRLAAGTYELAAQATARVGRVSFSLLDEARQVWVVSLGLEPECDGVRQRFTLDCDTDATLYLCAHNSDRAGPVRVEVQALGLAACDARAGLIVPPPEPWRPPALADLTSSAMVPVEGAFDAAITQRLGPAHGAASGILRGFTLRTVSPVGYDEIAELGAPLLPAGRYGLTGEVHVTRGFVAVSVIDMARSRWLVQLSFDPATRLAEGEMVLDVATPVRLVVTANNSTGAQCIEAELLQVALTVDPATAGASVMRVEPAAVVEARARRFVLPPLDGAAIKVGHLWDATLAPLFTGVVPHTGLRLFTREPRAGEEMLRMGQGLLPRGRYAVRASASVTRGAAAIAVVETATGRWLGHVRLDEAQSAGVAEIELAQPGAMTIVAAAANMGEPCPVDVSLDCLELVAYPPVPRELTALALARQEAHDLEVLLDAAEFADPRLGAWRAGGISAAPCAGDYLLVGRPRVLGPGIVELAAAGKVLDGHLVIGLVGEGDRGWLVQVGLTRQARAGAQVLRLETPQIVRLVVASGNDVPGPVVAKLDSISVAYIASASHSAPRVDTAT